MEKMTVGRLKQLLDKVPNNLVVYIGNDEELNGVHPAFFAQKVTDQDLENLRWCEFQDGKCFMIS